MRRLRLLPTLSMYAAGNPGEAFVPSWWEPVAIMRRGPVSIGPLSTPPALDFRDSADAPVNF